MRSPLLGSDGSAAIFGPQKEADPDEVTALEAGLERFAALIPVDPTTPGSGAAGGVGFGLLAWGAVLRSGAEAVSELIGLDEAVASSDLVITGEGRFDGQSAEGKTVSAVLAAAGRSGTDAALIAGSVDAPTDQFVLALSLSELAGSPADARADAPRWLQTAGASIAQLVTAQDTRPIAVGPHTTDRH